MYQMLDTMLNSTDMTSSLLKITNELLKKEKVSKKWVSDEENLP